MFETIVQVRAILKQLRAKRLRLCDVFTDTRYVFDGAQVLTGNGREIQRATLEVLVAERDVSLWRVALLVLRAYARPIGRLGYNTGFGLGLAFETLSQHCPDVVQTDPKVNRALRYYLLQREAEVVSRYNIFK